MNNLKFKLGTILFLLGFIGILTILTMDLPFDKLPKDVLEKYSIQSLKFLSLVQPIILLLISIIVGLKLYEKVKLDVPTINAFLKKEKAFSVVQGQLKYGITGGVFTGIIILTFTGLFDSVVKDEMLALSKSFQPSLISRIFYGGFTEEILMRFGLMTIFIWIFSKISHRLNSWIYWMGILLSSFLFAIGHFPIAFQTLGNPTNMLLIYILLGNTIGGLIFGWLYWKKGLEAAFIAHIFAHLIMIGGDKILS